MSNERFWTIPNVLSGYRLFSFPFVLGLAIGGYQRVFVVLFCINLITDILDGLIARVFKQQTALGARLDSLADIGSYILAIVGIFLFKYTDFEPHLPVFVGFLGLYLATEVVALIKFGKFPSLHLYSMKVGGYIQGFFFFVLFADQFYTGFFYFMIFTGSIAFIEHILVQLALPEMRSNQKGLYWVLRAKKN